MDNKAIGQSEDELIDQHLFVEALALCAFEILYNEPHPSDIEKVTFLCQVVLNHCRYAICSSE